MIDLSKLEAWFITGSQSLYGDETLGRVAADSGAIVEGLNSSGRIPVKVIFKPVAITPETIRGICEEANASPSCVGIIAWMHTFSPAKMWIGGLSVLAKPLAHLHTQFNRDIPWETIDMDFMNLNQSAHGDREFGFIGARMRLERTVVVGHWKEADVQDRLGTWARAACALHDARKLKIARFGDNMREVAVTEGDKVEAQLRFGYSVNGYGVGDLASSVKRVSEKSIDALVAEYDSDYAVAAPLGPGGARREELREAARIELGLRSFLETGGFGAFTTTFEDLYGLKQLPGLAVQRLMAEGYGFGAEGDWKTAALVRSMKVMAAGLPGGVSFMEDYTYHLDGSNPLVLGAHMLEVCPSIASGKPSLEIQPLGIGGKEDPVRLVFDVAAGKAVLATVIDMGNRFRMVLNEVVVKAPLRKMPKLPTARALWAPAPSLKTAAAAWIYAGGAHHSGFATSLDAGHLEDFAEMNGIECVRIGSDTNLASFKNELRWNEAYYMMRAR